MAIQHVVRYLSALLALSAIALLPGAASGQNFNPQNRQIGNLIVEVVRLPYTIEASTAQEIYDGLRSNPGGWVSWRRLYSWDYRAQGGNVGSCRLNEFELSVQFQLQYPIWEASEDADAGLAAAWEAFTGQLEEFWADLIEQDRRLARRMQRELETIAEPCSLARQAVLRLYERYRGRNAADVEGINDDPDSPLRWPPEGFEVAVDREAPPARRAAPAAPAARGDSEPAAAGPGGVSSGDRGSMPESFQEAASRDFGRAGVDSPALVMGLIREGEILGVEPMGPEGQEGTGATPTMDSRFAFPGLTEVLVSVLAVALDGGGLMDLDAPLSTWLPDLDAELGRVTLRQLLTHRAGLDNASIPDSTSWSTVMDRLSGEALFTEPGSIFSYSRYSFPLAVRAMEAAVGQPVENILGAAVFGPLGMTGTSMGAGGAGEGELAPGARIPDEMDFVDPAPGPGSRGPTLEGLPVVVTSVPDVTRFLAAVSDGTVQLLEAGELLSPNPMNPDEEISWAGGLWWRRIGGRDQVSLVCDVGDFGGAAGFSLMKGSGSGVVLWARDTWIPESARFLLAGTSQGLDEPADPWWVGGPDYQSSVEAGTWGRCSWPSGRTLAGVPSGLASAPGELAAWLGTYRNGDQLMGLEARDGRVVWAGSELEVVRISAVGYATRQGSQLVFPFRLVQDPEGRRYIVTRDRAFLMEEGAGSGG